MSSDSLENLENLIVERQESVAVLTFNRPRVLNALNSQTLDELRRAVLALRDDPSVRVVVLTGAGDKAFIAGADINELAELTSTAGLDYAVRGQQALDLVAGLGKPVIAAINGYALGGGCELAMACTIRLAAESARFGQPEINLGLIPGFGGSQRLARLVGGGRALELLLTGEPITAAEAHRIGLVNRVYPPADLMREALALAAKLAAKAPIATRCVIDAVQIGLDMSLPAAQAFEATLFGVTASTDDRREGTRAFLEKRKAVFQGR
jgi:enoyl-CoA hydratase